MPEFPHINLIRVNALENPEPMRELGLRRYPALASGERTISPIFMTRGRIRRFLSSL